MQKEHWHTPPIEEYYLVLRGTLKVKVEDSVFVLKPMQLLAVPPNKRHTIIDYSPPLQYFLIRNTISRARASQGDLSCMHAAKTSFC